MPWRQDRRQGNFFICHHPLSVIIRHQAIRYPSSAIRYPQSAIIRYQMPSSVINPPSDHHQTIRRNFFR
jgi:hypothetical protein